VGLRLGLLSTARINGAILAAAAQTDAVDVVAVASRDGHRARDYAAEHGIARAHGDYSSLLRDPDVEAVYIALPNALHAAWAERALAAGKHVLCEKPFSPDPALTAHCYTVAAAHGLVLTEAFMWRHLPQTQRLRELVSDGAIGELRLVRATFSFPLLREVDVRWDARLQGGALMDVGCYCVSGMRLLAGEPERVRGEAVAAPSGVDVRFPGLMRFPGDVLGTFDCAFDLPARAALEAVGSDGSLFVDDPWFGRAPAIFHRRDGHSEEIAVDHADPYVLELEDLAAAVAARRSPLLGRDDAVGQARALSALLASAAGGAEIDVAAPISSITEMEKT
jgi:D-xylose 1-dehydrogenase (NADP+, D-xylono-1,5-lactone-forming)